MMVNPDVDGYMLKPWIKGNYTAEYCSLQISII